MPKSTVFFFEEGEREGGGFLTLGKVNGKH